MSVLDKLEEEILNLETDLEDLDMAYRYLNLAIDHLADSSFCNTDRHLADLYRLVESVDQYRDEREEKLEELLEKEENNVTNN